MEAALAREAQQALERKRARDEDAIDVYAKLSVGRQEVAVMRMRSDLDMAGVEALVEARLGKRASKLSVRCADEIVELNELNLSFLMEDYRAKKIPHLALYA